jgi:hypothetical protein
MLLASEDQKGFPDLTTYSVAPRPSPGSQPMWSRTWKFSARPGDLQSPPRRVGEAIPRT